MAAKKESRSNVLLPTNTGQKEEESHPEEVKDSNVLIILDAL